MLLARDRRHEATALMRYALETALEADKPSAALRAYNNLTDVLMQADRYAEAAQTDDEGLQLARRLGNRYWEQILLGHVFPRFALGQWDEVLHRMGDLRGLDESLHARSSFTQGYVAFGSRIYIARGDLGAAERLLATFGEFRNSADAQEQLEFSAAEAVVQVARGDLAAARQSAEAVLGHVVEFGWVDARIKESVVLSVECSLALDDIATAESVLDTMGERARAQRMRFMLAQVSRLRALLAGRAGGTSAIDLRSQAIAQFREIERPYWTAVTLLEQGEDLVALGRAEEASPLLDESLALFAELGASPWLSRVTAALPQVAVTA
jgi:tetratricopeptide (TPR) repeat protein